MESNAQLVDKTTKVKDRITLSKKAKQTGKK